MPDWMKIISEKRKETWKEMTRAEMEEFEGLLVRGIQFHGARKEPGDGFRAAILYWRLLDLQELMGEKAYA